MPKENAPISALKNAINKSPTTNSPAKTRVEPYQKANPYMANIINIIEPNARPNRTPFLMPTARASFKFLAYLKYIDRHKKPYT